MTVFENVGLRWDSYDSRGTLTRVMDFITHGSIEYELCVEGGCNVIRRTERHGSGTRPTVTETGRWMTWRATLDLWKLIVMGDGG